MLKFRNFHFFWGGSFKKKTGPRFKFGENILCSHRKLYPKDLTKLSLKFSKKNNEILKIQQFYEYKKKSKMSIISEYRQ